MSTSGHNFKLTWVTVVANGEPRGDIAADTLQSLCASDSGATNPGRTLPDDLREVTLGERVSLVSC
jgi:hypothetical protein